MRIQTKNLKDLHYELHDYFDTETKQGIIITFGLLFLMSCTAQIVSLTSNFLTQGFFYDPRYYFRFHFPKLFPIIIFGIYLLNEGFKTKPFTRPFKLLSKCLTLLTVASILILVTGILLKLSTTFWFSQDFDWSYEAMLTYPITYLLLKHVLDKKIGEADYKTTLLVLAVTAIGFIYEAPIYHYSAHMVGGYTHLTQPLLISTDILSYYFMVAMLFRYKWTWTKTMSISVLVYALFFALYYNNMHLEPLNPYYAQWIPRVFGILLVYGFFSGIKNGKVLSKPETPKVLYSPN